MPMRRVFSAANRLLLANRLNARPLIRVNFFMMGLSRSLLEVCCKTEESVEAWTCLELSCTYNSILDFYVLIVNGATAMRSIAAVRRDEALQREESFQRSAAA
ncbi:hypothetical protein D3C76_1209890 [compost metagenome]